MIDLPLSVAGKRAVKPTKFTKDMDADKVYYEYENASVVQRRTSKRLCQSALVFFVCEIRLTLIESLCSGLYCFSETGYLDDSV
jgi:hypothetical protein